MSELTANFTRAIKAESDSVVLSCASFTVGGVVVLANAVIVAAVARYRRLWTRANLYVVSLSCTDVMVGLYQLLLAASYLPATSAFFHTHKAPCVLMFAWGYSTVACSLFNMCLIAFDRYFFFSRPLHYHIVFTDRKARAAVCVVWLVAMLYGSCVLLVNTFSVETGCIVFTTVPRFYRIYTPAAIVIPSAVTIACLYVAIIRLTLKHIRFAAMQKRAHVFSAKPRPVFSTCTSAQDAQSLQVDGILPAGASSSGPGRQTALSPSPAQTESRHTESRHTESRHTGSQHTGSRHTGSQHTGSRHTGSRHTGSRHTEGRHPSSGQGRPAVPPASPEKNAAASPASSSSLKSLKLFIIVFGLLVIFWSPYIITELVSVHHQVGTTAHFAALFMGFLNSGINVFVYPAFNPRFREVLKHMLTCGLMTNVRRDVP